MATSFIHIAISAALIALTACGSNHAKQDNEDKHVSIVPDTLHAATLYFTTSYFNYRGRQMGFDYENLKRFADDEGMVLDLKVASSLQSLLRMVSEGEADLAAYPVPSIEEYNKIVKHCGHKEVTWQVLVQPAGKTEFPMSPNLLAKQCM